MIFPSTKLHVKLDSSASWQLMSAGALYTHAQKAPPGSIQLLSYNGKGFVESAMTCAYVVTFSKNAIQVKLPRDASVPGSLVMSSVISRDANVAVVRSVSHLNIPDQSGLHWKAARDLTGSEEFLCKGASDKKPTTLVADSVRSGSSTKSSTVYRFDADTWRNVVLASGLILRGY
jgi:hypothetical protein